MFKMFFPRNVLYIIINTSREEKIKKSEIPFIFLIFFFLQPKRGDYKKGAL